MKRLTLELDLSENEIFDKEVTDAIRAQVREVVRNTCGEIIKEEAECEVKRQLGEVGWDYYQGEIRNAVKSVAYSILEPIVRGIDFEEITKQTVDKRMDYTLSFYDVEGKCEDVLKAKINDAVARKLKEILN